MSKMFVVGPKSALPKVVSKLHELKIAHIIEHKKGDYDLCTPLNQFEKTSSLLTQIRSIMSHLDISGDPQLKKFSLNTLEKTISNLKAKVTETINEIKKTEDSLSNISEQKKILKLLALLDISSENFRKSNYINSYLGYVDDLEIKDKLKKITENFEFFNAEDNKKNLIAVFVDSKFKEEFEKVLLNAPFSEIETIPIELEGSTMDKLEQLGKKERELENSSEQLKQQSKALAKEYSDFCINAEKFLSTETEKGQAPLSYGSTKEAFFLRCYLPKADVEKTKEVLISTADNKLYINEESIDKDEEIPIKMKNSKYVQNSEFFTKIFALPKYNEFDPSILIAYTFPLFFGFMLGDVIYGLITFSLFYYLRKKYPIGKQFFNMMLAASVGAIIFGFLYGEFGGLELYHFWIQRTHDFNTLMAISIIAGIVHVNFGLILGFIQEYKEHGLFAATTHKFSWILLQLGGVLFLGPLLNMLVVPPPLFYLGIILFSLAVLMLIKAEGFVAVMEIPSILTHIMSYARLMAVGLASVFIAVLVNDLVSFLFHKGFLFWPLALIALVIGHTFNIALGILSPSLHSIRLHYVEFFSKFYEGGGVEYEPFGAEKQKSLI
tara:strand:+ start:972 stop:2795 length:1824 start_codon:yes stop_codon:yes gene_type:complete